MDAVIQAASAQLEQFMTQSFAGYRYYNCEFPRCLLWGDTTPRGATKSQRQTWIWFMRFTDGYYLKPVWVLTLTFRVHCFDPTNIFFVGFFNFLYIFYFFFCIFFSFYI